MSSDNTKKSTAPVQPSGRPPEKKVQSEFMRKLTKGPAQTWKLYRQSKTGLVGLAIMVSFLIMAIFAPILAPYSVDFRAPSDDVFVADSETKVVPAEHNWTSPMGLTDGTRENKLESILLYASDGEALLFPVETGTQEIVIQDPLVYTLPSDSSWIRYVHFPRTVSEQSFFFILKGETLYEYTSNLVDANKDYNLGFTPAYVSNLWNGYSQTLPEGRMAVVFADDHNLTLIDKRPRPRSGLEPDVKTFWSNLTIEDDTVIANPLVIDSDYFENGSMLIVACGSGLRAYRLDVAKSNLTAVVTNVQIGAMMWRKNYSIEGEAFNPIDSPYMMTYAFPQDASSAYGKTKVIVATQDDRVVAYKRETGEIEWTQVLIMPLVREPQMTGLYPSPTNVVVVGTYGDRGFIAGLNPDHGNIDYNGTMYSTTESPINSAPQYVRGLRTWAYSTEQSIIYLSNEILGVNVTFSVPGGAALTPVSFLGNIYIQDSVTGNYFAIVTGDNSLFVETLSGVNMAPLPPGTYPSGNRYILGTDYEGHDILSWVIHGTRAELMVGITAAFFAVVIGTIVGLVSGFYPGTIDNILMRTTDVVLSLPGLVVLLLFAAVLGPSIMNIIIIFAVLSWAGIARVIRSVTLSLKERAFVDAAIVAGASDGRLIFKHIAPNVLPYTFLYMTFTISGAIVTEAILAFLGFGDVTHVTWGMMLQYLQISGHALDAPWWLLPPGICITLLSLSFYLIGRSFDEVVNPRLRKR